MSESVADLLANKSSLEMVTEHITPAAPHSIFYFEPVVFRVDNILFKVPKRGFMVTGTIFPDMFSLPIAAGITEQGSSDSNPIDLPADISQTDFTGFLLLLYPYFGHTRNDGEPTYEELVGALKLATMWEFNQIRKTAIYSLSSILKSRKVVEKILLAKQYRVKKWLCEGYLLLVATENLSIRDLRAPLVLDWETIAGIFATQSYSRKHLSFGESGISVEKYLDTVFEKEFRDVRLEEE